MTEFLADVADGRRRLLERVDQLAAVWEQAQAVTGEDPRAGGLVAGDLAKVRADLERQRFTIGLFGLIKRGKSTLLNALLGGELSPTHVTPETAVPVYVDHGDAPQAVVHLASGESGPVAPGAVGEWTSQKHNAGNHRGVTHLQWNFPSPLLRHGVRVVDTPGLDDADADDLYTRRTIQELEAADAGILVFMSPPTVGATEMAFLTDVTAAQLHRTVLVANLFPQHYHDPEVRAQVLEYVQRRIAEATGEPDVHLHAICAEEAWQARRYGDEAGWVTAGGAELLAALEETIAANTGRRVLERAEAALDRTRQVAAAAIDLRVQTLSGDGEDEQHERMQAHHQRLSDDGEDLLERRLVGVTGMRAQLHAIVQQSFLRTRSAIRAAGSIDELDGLVAHFTREVEVVTEDAFRMLHNRLMAVHAEVDEEFDAGVTATLHDLGARLPGMRGLGGEGRHALPQAPSLIARTTVHGAAVGGIVAGGAGVALVGAVLGPIGLVAGALAGWRLGEVVRRGRELRPVRAELDEELSAVADAVLGEFDQRVDDVVAAVRETSRHRRAGFATDLAGTLAVLERCPPGSAARADALVALRGLAAHLRHLPRAGALIDLDVADEDRGELVAVRGDGLEPPTLAV